MVASGSRLFRYLAGGLLSGLVLLCIGFAFFISHIEALSDAEAPRDADAIIVLTGGQSRIETGVELLREGKGRRLLISGVHPDTSLSQIRRAVGANRDIFGCCVDIDKAALDTVGNAEQAGAWARRYGFRSVIVVTSYYHMPRSLLEMRRKLPDIDIRPAFVLPATRHSPWFADAEALRVVVPDSFKYLVAILRLGVRESETRTAIAGGMIW